MPASDLESAFPGLSGTKYQITSAATPDYNCIAWAAAEDFRWWEPDPFGVYFWPDGVGRTAHHTSYLQAFARLGYELAENDALEPGFEKVALFVSANGLPSHMARQLRDGLWTSKLGPDVDITHAEVKDLEGTLYGAVFLVLRRPLKQGE